MTMGLASWLTGSAPGDDRIDEEVAVDVMQHDAYRRAGAQAARRLRGDGGPLPHDQLSEAAADAEKHVPRWLW
jgi:hypothetical protein